MEKEKDDTKEMTIGMKSKVRLDLVLALAPVMVGLIMLYIKLDAIEARLDKSWTYQEQVLWAEQFAGQNPTVKVPSAKEVFNLMADPPKKSQ
jgi:hypothetical protein